MKPRKNSFASAKNRLDDETDMTDKQDSSSDFQSINVAIDTGDSLLPGILTEQQPLMSPSEPGGTRPTAMLAARDEDNQDTTRLAGGEQSSSQAWPLLPQTSAQVRGGKRYNGTSPSSAYLEHSPLQPTSPHEERVSTDPLGIIEGYNRRLSQGSAPDNSRIKENRQEEDRLVEAHALAHRITLNALLGNEEALKNYPFTDPPVGVQRWSAATSAASRKDKHGGSKTLTNAKQPSSSRPLPQTPHTGSPSQPLRKSFARSRFLSSGDKVHNHPLASNPPNDVPGMPVRLPVDTILGISIRRKNPSSKMRSTNIVIPAETSAPMQSTIANEKGRYADNAEFDDEQLFNELRASYLKLTSRGLRWFGARKLTRIVVSLASEQHESSLWISDKCSIEQYLLRCFRKPARGRARFDMVAWARGETLTPPCAQELSTTAAASTAPNSSSQRELHATQGRSARSIPRDFRRNRSVPEGFEFVLGWSAARILFVLFLILAITLFLALWLILDKDVPIPGSSGDDRMTGSILAAIGFLLFALGGMAGWLFWSRTVL